MRSTPGPGIPWATARSLLQVSFLLKIWTPWHQSFVQLWQILGHVLLTAVESMTYRHSRQAKRECNLWSWSPLGDQPAVCCK